MIISTPLPELHGGGVMLCHAPLIKGGARLNTSDDAPNRLRKSGCKTYLRELRDIPARQRMRIIGKGVRR